MAEIAQNQPESFKKLLDSLDSDWSATPSEFILNNMLNPNKFRMHTDAKVGGCHIEFKSLGNALKLMH